MYSSSAKLYFWESHFVLKIASTSEVVTHSTKDTIKYWAINKTSWDRREGVATAESPLIGLVETGFTLWKPDCLKSTPALY